MAAATMISTTVSSLAYASRVDYEKFRARVFDNRDNWNTSLDTMWVLVCTSMVFMMHAGFSLLEAGSVRSMNAQNILAKNLLVVTVGFMCWYVLGWAFAIGSDADTNKFIGGHGFFMMGFMDDKKLYRDWIFQGMFCATGGTIVSGAMAERTKLKGFTIFTIIMTTIIYPMVVHWAWSTRGFLAWKNPDGSFESIVGPPFIDFSGSGVVHVVGGVAALLGAMIVGPRHGRFGPEDNGRFDAHSIPFCVLGTFILFFGWYGFNPGSTHEMHTEKVANIASIVAVNTTISPCISGMTVFFMRARVFQPKRLDVSGFCNGTLAGLVAVTASCATIKAWESAIIGFVAAFVYQGASRLLPRFQIDDVVDAFAVHGANGTWAVIAAGLFGDPGHGIGGNGVFYGGNQLGVQLLGWLIIVSWSGVLSTCVLFPLRLVGFLRLSDDFQKKGADAMEHSPERAYATSHKEGSNFDASA